MNWISSITNPNTKVLRKATGFSGTVLNIYPWPVSSVVTRLKLTGLASGSTVMNTGPLLGTNIAALSNVFASPVRVTIDQGIDGEYKNQDGVNVLNPSNIPYLRINFEKRIGPVDIYLEGYEVGSQYLPLNDKTRSINTRYNRILIGTTSEITSFIKNATPIAFRTVSGNNTIAGLDSNPVSFNLGGATYVYLASNSTFSGFQINLGSEGYLRTRVYTIEYWNGTSWTPVGGTINSTTSVDNDTTLIFQQSGIVAFTKPSDWAKTTIPGDPGAPTDINDQNYEYSNSQYYIRIVPPTPNAETIPVNGIALFD
jgi:hypothetical protein